MTTESTVVHLKLVSGQDVVGELLDEDEKAVILRWPYLLEFQGVPVPGQDGMQTLQFTNYLPFNTLSLASFSQEHIVTSAVVDPTFAEYYRHTVLYQLNFLEPKQQQRLESINKSMEFMLSNENLAFLEKLKEFQDRIPQDFPTSLQ